MSIRQEAPPAVGNSRYPELLQLVEKALANRGEWFSTDKPPNIATNTHTAIRAFIFSRLEGIDIATRDDAVYLRIADKL